MITGVNSEMKKRELDELYALLRNMEEKKAPWLNGLFRPPCWRRCSSEHTICCAGKSAQDCSTHSGWCCSCGCCCRFLSGKPPSAWQIFCRRLNPTAVMQTEPAAAPPAQAASTPEPAAPAAPVQTPAQPVQRPASMPAQAETGSAEPEKSAQKPAVSVRKIFMLVWASGAALLGAVVPILQSPVRSAAAGGRSARDRAEGGPSGCPADANRAVAVPVRAFPARRSM